MRLEEEHQRLHSRGEMIKFAILVIIMLLTVLTVSALRPLIFEEMVPAVLGWNEIGDAPPAPPEASATPATPTPQVTATEGTTAQGNPTATGTPPPDTSAPSPTPRTYQVQAGDTLVEIAERFGVPLPALVQANNIANPDRIQPGDVLVIPGG